MPSLLILNVCHRVPRRKHFYVNSAPDILFLFLRQSTSSVIRSNSPTATSQIMARKKRRGVCGFFLFISCNPAECVTVVFFHYEEVYHVCIHKLSLLFCFLWDR